MSMLDEAERCLKCKKPRCSANCPVGTPVPQVMELFLKGEIREAGKILFKNNPLAAVTSVVCPHENNCYGNCVLGIKGNSVQYYEIEQYISNFYLETEHMVPPESNHIRVAVIGAGPAGITASLCLALKGFDVTLIEAREEIGGVLRYGIPAFRLPKGVLNQYDRVLYELGVKFKPNTFIGSNLMIQDMFMDGFKAVFIAVGTARPNKLGLLGETLGNVYYAIDYLRSPESYHLGKNVVVIGAGNVAMDAARMAVRKVPGSTVTLLNNRDEEKMTGSKHEIQMAQVDGVKFRHMLATLRLTDRSVVCAQVEKTGEPGHEVYEENMTKIVEVPADSIIVAIGQGPQAAVLTNTKVEQSTHGLVAVDETGRTTIPGVYAAGDIVTGPRTVVEAVAFSRKVADEIERYCLDN